MTKNKQPNVKPVAWQLVKITFTLSVACEGNLFLKHEITVIYDNSWRICTYICIYIYHIHLWQCTCNVWMSTYTNCACGFHVSLFMVHCAAQPWCWEDWLDEGTCGETRRERIYHFHLTYLSPSVSLMCGVNHNGITFNACGCMSNTPNASEGPSERHVRTEVYSMWLHYFVVLCVFCIFSTHFFASNLKVQFVKFSSI